jgi:hypothetical protein
MPQPQDRVNVFAGATIEADLVRLHLQEQGIDARLENENVGTVAPYAAAGGGAGAVRVSVPVTDESRARELIERHRSDSK